MSEENHPNINAAGWTTDIMSSFMSRLRGPAEQDKTVALEVLHTRIVTFITDVSRDLDDTFGDY